MNGSDVLLVIIRLCTNYGDIVSSHQVSDEWMNEQMKLSTIIHKLLFLKS